MNLKNKGVLLKPVDASIFQFELFLLKKSRHHLELLLIATAMRSDFQILKSQNPRIMLCMNED